MNAAPGEAASTAKPSFLRKNLELIVAILLGIVSVSTAYASFQSALYESAMAAHYTLSQNAGIEAESAYLEANQQYYQDVTTVHTVEQLRFDVAHAVPLAQERLDLVLTTEVYPELADAIAWADGQNAGGGDYITPLDSEEYLDVLYGAYYERNQVADDELRAGDVANGLSDRLILNTVLMAIALFLLGVAAVVRELRVQIVLVSVSVGIYIVAAVLTVQIPTLAI